MSGHYPAGAEPNEAALLETLRDVVEVLGADGVDYLLMGGIGAYSHARPRVTDDIDVFVRPGDVDRVVTALSANGFDTLVHDPSWLAKAFKREVLVDIIFRSSGDLYLDDEMLLRRHIVEHKGIAAPLVSPEDLLVIKALAAAEATPHHWYDALGIIARCDLDWDYVIERASRSGARRILSLLLYAESSDLIVPPRIVATLYDVVHPVTEPRP